MTKHTNVITLPRAFAGLGSRYVTRAGAMWQPETVALCFALTLRQHGTAEAVRATAKRLASRVCREQQPRLNALARRPTNEAQHQRDPRVKLDGVRDRDVLPVALNIINRVCDLVRIAPEQPFTLDTDADHAHRNPQPQA